MKISAQIEIQNRNTNTHTNTLEAALLPRFVEDDFERLLRKALISCLSTYVKPIKFYFNIKNENTFHCNLQFFHEKILDIHTKQFEIIQLKFEGCFQGNYFLRKCSGLCKGSDEVRVRNRAADLTSPS